MGLSPAGLPPGFALTEGRDAYARFVSSMKLLLPLCALLLVGVVFAWPQIAERAERFQLTFAELDPSQADLTSIVNARYLGVDSKDQPYTLTADLARELGPAKDLVHLFSPKGDQIRSDDKWLSLEGDTGYYTKSKDLLDLAGNVILYRDDGYQFHTETARLFLDRDEAVGSDEVRGYGITGEVISEGFQINDGGQVILFTNTAWLLLYNGGEERTQGRVMSIPDRPDLPPRFASLPQTTTPSFYDGGTVPPAALSVQPGGIPVLNTAPAPQEAGVPPSSGGIETAAPQDPTVAPPLAKPAPPAQWDQETRP